MSIWLLIPILIPVIAGAALPYAVPRTDRNALHRYVALVVALNAVVVVLLVAGYGDTSLRALELTSAINLFLRLDDLARFFMVLASGLWLIVTFYSFGYIQPEGGKDRTFYAFYMITYGVIMGACMAGNFFTLYLFYELITLATYPLVVHSRTPEAKRAGAKYLMYSFFGAALALVAFFFIADYGLTTDFVAGGVLVPALVAGNETMLLVVFLLAFVGFGCKAYIWPLFEWVPASYPLAPAPAAALLSGVVSKVAVLAIIRTTFYLFGADFVYGTWAQTALLCMALLTVFMGSMLAFKEKVFAKRLAFSSVGQLSYVLFGIILLNPLALLGALLHVVFHGIIKVALFLCAGAVTFKTDRKYVYEMRAVGKAMPITMWCFTLAAVSLVGVPPTGGFVSKWSLAMGAIGSNHPTLGLVGVGVLLVSALLTAGYLVTIFADAFFPGAGYSYKKLVNAEPGKIMTVPLIVLAALGILLGMFPGALIGFIQGITVVAMGGGGL
ncbi:MAG: proton-conducting membrane transporter [Defluviitaleaceae bacterium]|nr:proton-conducting membrane transporter [Defluviitaleaceae bacterium]